MVSDPGRCFKCENPIVNGGHEWCQAWARDEIKKLRKEVKDREDDIQYIEREARAELREAQWRADEVERESERW